MGEVVAGQVRRSQDERLAERIAVLGPPRPLDGTQLPSGVTPGCVSGVVPSRLKDLPRYRLQHR
eukprot:5257328-Alexandrium_andersonii.AAC.1